jgi:hypothetical protein
MTSEALTVKSDIYFGHTGLSDQVIAQRGVRHGRLILMPIDFKSKVNARKRMSELRRPHR